MGSFPSHLQVDNVETVDEFRDESDKQLADKRRQCERKLSTAIELESLHEKTLSGEITESSENILETVQEETENLEYPAEGEGSVEMVDNVKTKNRRKRKKRKKSISDLLDR